MHHLLQASCHLLLELFVQLMIWLRLCRFTVFNAFELLYISNLDCFLVYFLKFLFISDLHDSTFIFVFLLLYQNFSFFKNFFLFELHLLYNFTISLIVLVLPLFQSLNSKLKHLPIRRNRIFFLCFGPYNSF